MKIKTLLFLGIFLCSFGLKSKNVDINEAKILALNFYYERINLKTKTDFNSLKITGVYTETEANQSLYYCFNINDKGFIFICADDVVFPVLGYSFTSTYDPTKMAPEFTEWIGDYKSQIKTILNAKVDATPEVNKAWNDLRNFWNEPSQKEIMDLGPLLTTTWDQGFPYNSLCPVDAAATTGGRCPVGCVATSMSQIMNYYKYPLHGIGTHSYNASTYGIQSANFAATNYDWVSMVDNPTTANPGLATLCYQAGVSVDMSYAPDGSGSQTSKAKASLITYFGYSNASSYIQRAIYSSDASWVAALKTSLDAKKPIIYSGYTSATGAGGHAWICDGYQGTDYYHMNWGWSGSGNGYFLLSNLNSIGGTFGYGHQAIINIYPGSGYPYNCTGQKTITQTYGVFDDGSGPSQYLSNNDCTWLIAPVNPSGVATIKLTVENLDTEAGHDSVIVYNGNTTTSPILGTFAGITVPTQMFTSTGDQMLVRFISDGNTVKGDGFRLSYTSTSPVHCSGTVTLTNPSDTIEDGSGTYYYNNSTICRWKIQPTGASSVTLNFLELNTENGVDFVKIYKDFSATAANLLGTYSGTTLPASITSTTGKMYIVFAPNNATPGLGWKVSYNSVLTNVEESINKSFSVYPNPSDGKLSINFSSEKMKTLDVKIINLIGETIYSEALKDFDGRYSKSLDLSAQAKGIYFIQINADNKIINKKIIIQ